VRAVLRFADDSEPDCLGQVQPAVHGAHGVRPENSQGEPLRALAAADRVGLRGIGIQRRHTQNLRHLARRLGVRCKDDTELALGTRERAQRFFGKAASAGYASGPNFRDGETHLGNGRVVNELPGNRLRHRG
jgi:hypothetical protein